MKESAESNSEHDGKTNALKSDRVVWIVFFSLLIDLLAFTVILPLFPSLLEFYGSNNKVWCIFDIYLDETTQH